MSNVLIPAAPRIHAARHLRGALDPIPDNSIKVEQLADSVLNLPRVVAEWSLSEAAGLTGYQFGTGGYAISTWGSFAVNLPAISGLTRQYRVVGKVHYSPIAQTTQCVYDWRFNNAPIPFTYTRVINSNSANCFLDFVGNWFSSTALDSTADGFGAGAANTVEGQANWAGGVGSCWMLHIIIFGRYVRP